jgi:hypothetical protein
MRTESQGYRRPRRKQTRLRGMALYLDLRRSPRSCARRRRDGSRADRQPAHQAQTEGLPSLELGRDPALLPSSCPTRGPFLQALTADIFLAMSEQDPRPALREAYGHYGPDWVRAIDYGIDVSLIAHNLELTVEERLLQLQEMSNLYSMLRPDEVDG